MGEHISYGEIKLLRKAVLKDSDFVFNLRNQKYVREVSWSTKPIIKEEHEKFWKDNYQYYWIIQELSQNEPIGFVRVKSGEVSIAILKSFWNEQYGYFAMQQITEMFPGVRAEVKLENTHSLHFFIRCGFFPDGFILNKKE